MRWILLGLLLAGCSSATPAVSTSPVPGCALRLLELNQKLCAEHGGELIFAPGFSAPCGACRLP